MEPFAGIAHEDLLKLVISVAALLGVARLFGEMFERMRQPAVIGEILAGVVLGPSLLGRFAPSLGRWIIPETVIQSQLLDVVALLGVMTLILLVGMETDLVLIRTRIRTATAIGLGGLFVPLVFGIFLGNYLPESLMGPDASRLTFNLFLAVALALSAIPVLAKILADLKLLRGEFGQTSLAAGMIDDVLGWMLLGLVTSLATAGRVTIGDFGRTAGAVLLFLIATVIVLGPLTRRALILIQDRFRIRDRVLTLVVVLGFAWGAFTQALHLEPIVGAFAAGMMFGRLRRLSVEVGRQLESLTYGILAPIFLATAGLKLQIDVLFRPDLIAVTALVLLVAASGKLIGSFVGARFFAGIGARHAIAYGFALNARGVLGIIVAGIGLSMGIFGAEMYSVLVVVSLLTSVMAPVGLRRLLAAGESGESSPPSETLSFSRILVAVRIRDTVDDVSRALDIGVLERLQGPSPAITLMAVVDVSERRRASEYLTGLAKMLPPGVEISMKVVSGELVQAIVAEAANGYDLLALGAPEPHSGDEHLFGAKIDQLVRLSPCPSMIFARRGGSWPPENILVPTGGASAASKAADMAFAISDENSRVMLFHVVDPELAPTGSTSVHSSAGLRLELGYNMLGSVREIGESLGVSVTSEVQMGRGVVSSILARAEHDIDLMIVGTNVRSGSQRLYLGPKVERLVAESTCSMIIFNV